MKIRKFILPGIILLMGINSAQSQTTTNPDISFIGDFRAVARRDSPDGNDNPQLNFDELEVAGSGHLNPYSRGDIVLAVTSAGETEIEEAYATVLRGLPLKLQVRAGKYLVDIGKLNTQHPHQWSWMERPLMFQYFLGEEGLTDVGINVTTLIPVGTSALGISGNVLKGAFFLPEDAADVPPMAGSGRFSYFAPLTDYSQIELGISALHAQDDFAYKQWATLGDLDFKYKWKPTMYNSLTIVAEAMTSRKTIVSDTLSPEVTEDVSAFGAFAAFDYQFRRRFNIGSFFDYSQSSFDDDIDQTAFGVFAGFEIAEETYRLGLLLRHDNATELENGVDTIQLQLLWSLGPHKPHVF